MPCLSLLRHLADLEGTDGDWQGRRRVGEDSLPQRDAFVVHGERISAHFGKCFGRKLNLPRSSFTWLGFDFRDGHARKPGSPSNPAPKALHKVYI